MTKEGKMLIRSVLVIGRALNLMANIVIEMAARNHVAKDMINEFKNEARAVAIEGGAIRMEMNEDNGEL